jgi:hypothetical protein
MRDELYLWVVCDHPRDYPDGFIARRHAVTAVGSGPTSEVLVSADLEAIRAVLEGWGLTRLARDPLDDLLQALADVPEAEATPAPGAPRWPGSPPTFSGRAPWRAMCAPRTMAEVATEMDAIYRRLAPSALGRLHALARSTRALDLQWPMDLAAARRAGPGTG